jgi:hypothetical protein
MSPPLTETLFHPQSFVAAHYGIHHHNSRLGLYYDLLKLVSLPSQRGKGVGWGITRKGRPTARVIRK